MPILDTSAMLYGLGALVALGLSWLGRRYAPDGPAVAGLLGATWIATKLIAWSFRSFDAQLQGWPLVWSLYPFFDCLTGLAVLLLWIGHQDAWKLVVVGLSVAKLIVHTAHAPFIVAALHHRLIPGGHDYVVFCNIAWAIALAVVALAGGGRAAGDLLSLVPGSPFHRAFVLPRMAQASCRKTAKGA